MAGAPPRPPPLTSRSPLIAGPCHGQHYSDEPTSGLITGLIWTGAADPVELPIPAGLTQAGAAAITDGGTVGGYGFNDRSEALPVLWSCR